MTETTVNTTAQKLENIKKILSESNQSHLLKYYDELKTDEQNDFLEQLSNIDFKEVISLFQKAQAGEDKRKAPGKMKPVSPEVEKDVDAKTLKEYRNIGLEEISKGSVAIVCLAGGQGTRLGLPFPKGMCPTGIPSEKSLFQLQAERIKRLTEVAETETGKSGAKIFWYIMTSSMTHTLTDKYLKENRFFGLPEEDVRLFKQESLPAFDFDGNILLEERDSVALAPDGNGGIYRALLKNGILDEMDNKNIKYVHAHSVDNILVKVADPVFIGKCVKSGADCGVKVIKKTDPSEPLGVICKIDKHYQVVEYSEISKDKATSRNDKNDLIFSAGNICNHFFSTEFLRKIAENYETNLKAHIAKKICTFVGPDGDKIRPNSPNSIKLEKFIFDVVPFSENFIMWEVTRESDFSPVKNNEDTKKDCFMTAKRDLLNLHKAYLEKVGCTVKCEGVEISPLLSYSGENLEKYKGETFEEVTILYSENEINKCHESNGVECLEQE